MPKIISANLNGIRSASKKGYSGAGLYSKAKPDAIFIGFGSKEFDAESRYVRCEFKANSSINCANYSHL